MATCLLKGLCTFINFFFTIFLYFFFAYVLKNQIICHFKATFIQGATFIVFARCSRGYVNTRGVCLIRSLEYGKLAVCIMEQGQCSASNTQHITMKVFNGDALSWIRCLWTIIDIWRIH